VNPHTVAAQIDGPVGLLELAIDRPAQPRPGGGVAVVSHPHPLFGGTMNNKVVQTLARAYLQAGWTTVRYNFRGVGGSAGAFDHGQGETQDLLAVVADQAPEGVLALAGFSFGAFVTANAVPALVGTRPLHSLLLVGTAASRFEVSPVPPELHERTLVIHGEMDDTVPLAAVLDWARPQALPVTVVPGGEHFFHGRLPLLKSLALRHIESL
jgi:alpha/beta superfamily hydrolase